MKTHFMRMLLLLSLVGTLSIVHGQFSNSFKDVLKVELSKMAPIYENGIVKGYYMFYNLDKVDKDNRSFMIKILDENTREVASPIITRPKTYLLDEVVFNGEVLFFSFIDPKNEKVEYITIDKRGEILGTKVIDEVAEWDEEYVYTIRFYKNKKARKNANGTTSSYGSVSGGEEKYGNIIPATNKGFVIFRSGRVNKKSYAKTEFIPNDLSTKGWALNGIGSVVNIVGDYLLLSTGGYSVEIKVINLAKGKTVLKRQLSNKRYKNELLEYFFDEEKKEVIMLNRYYSKEKRGLLSNKSFYSLGLGVYGVRLNLENEVVGKNLTPWGEEIEKHIKVDKKGRLSNSMSLRIKNTLYVNNKFYLFGEIGSGYTYQPNSKDPVGSDFYIIELNSDFSLSNIYSWDWGGTKIRYPKSGEDSTKSNITRNSQIRNFAYLFSKESKDKKTFFTAYIAMEREKGLKQKRILWVVSKSEDGFTEDRIDLETEASQINILPAKPGYILLVEYFEKENKVDMRLEKFNY